jgi:hypothetical protein
MSSGGQSPARKIWIDVALGGAARCRRVALSQRRIAALVIVGPEAVHVQANRISRIVRLGHSWRRHQSRRDRKNRQSWNAHQSLLRDLRVFRIPSSVPAPVNSRSRQNSMTPALFVEFGFEALRRLRFGVIVARIALRTWSSRTAAGAGVLALERSIRVRLAHPAAVLANGALHVPGTPAPGFSFTQSYHAAPIYPIERLKKRVKLGNA